MQTEDRYDDLTALFEAQDDALQSEAFVERVMQPVRKRTRWRTPLLFGAGGIGTGPGREDEHGTVRAGRTLEHVDVADIGNGIEVDRGRLAVIGGASGDTRQQRGHDRERQPRDLGAVPPRPPARALGPRPLRW